MSKSTKTEAEELLNTQNATSETPNKNSSLINKTPIHGTPFEWIETPEGSFIAYGKFRLTKEEEIGDNSPAEWLMFNTFEVVNRMITAVVYSHEIHRHGEMLQKDIEKVEGL